MSDVKTVRFVPIHPKAQAPTFAVEQSSGADLRTVEDFTLAPGEYRLVQTGLTVELPPGTEMQVRPRSGLAAKHGVTVLNSPGTVDEGYRGEIGVILINHGKEPVSFSCGDRIAQAVIMEVPRVVYEQVTELSVTKRDRGGFGSTGVD